MRALAEAGKRGCHSELSAERVVSRRIFWNVSINASNLVKKLGTESNCLPKVQPHTSLRKSFKLAGHRLSRPYFALTSKT